MSKEIRKSNVARRTIAAVRKHKVATAMTVGLLASGAVGYEFLGVKTGIKHGFSKTNYELEQRDLRCATYVGTLGVGHVEAPTVTVANLTPAQKKDCNINIGKSEDTLKPTIAAVQVQLPSTDTLHEAADAAHYQAVTAEGLDRIAAVAVAWAFFGTFAGGIAATNTIRGARNS